MNLDYRDPIVGLIALFALIFVISLIHYCIKLIKQTKDNIEFNNFIKNYENIDNNYKNILKSANLSFDNLIFIASIFTKCGEFDKAIQTYLIILDKNTNQNNEELVLTELGLLYFKAGFIEKSKEILLKTLNNRPRNKKALITLKTIYFKLQDYKKILEVLTCLFELGDDIRLEKNFIKALIIEKDPNKNTKEKIDQILQISDDNIFIKRLLLQNYNIKSQIPYKYIIDLLYTTDKIIDINDTQIKALNILKNNQINTILHFSYTCSKCKNTLPVFFYHCPICYNFAECQINYEIKINEKN